jgi:hypothetical protein
MKKIGIYFPHEADKRRDIKVLSLRREHGNVVYGLFWIIVEILRTQDNFRLEYCDNTWNGLSEEFSAGRHRHSPGQAKGFIDTFIQHRLLEKNDQYFWSPDLLEQMKAMIEISEKRAAAAQRRWQKKREPEDKSIRVW